MITKEQLRILPEGTPVSYGPYGNVEFVRETMIKENGEYHTEPHVVMRDKHGNEKRVFSSLFLKYATVKA
jgi:hypothetical protein